MSAETLGHAIDCPHAATARNGTVVMPPTDNACSAVNTIVSAMPDASTRASPNRFDSLPVRKIWLSAATTPTTANALPTCCGPQAKRACVHKPKTYSVPLNAQPARKVTSISRLMIELDIALPITAQRLG